MSEIRKMYENAGIEKLSVCEYTCMNATNCNVNCVHYNDKMTYYPPFTVEKQLSLITFLINRKVELSFKAEQGEITVEAISRGLAGIINRIWQHLTEEERKQIREILK